MEGAASEEGVSSALRTAITRGLVSKTERLGGGETRPFYSLTTKGWAESLDHYFSKRTSTDNRLMISGGRIPKYSDEKYDGSKFQMPKILAALPSYDALLPIL